MDLSHAAALAVLSLVAGCRSEVSSSAGAGGGAVTDAATGAASPANPADSGVAASLIGRGTPLWVEENPSQPYIDARVDVGTLRSLGDPHVLEVVIQWPYAPGTLAVWQAAHPEMTLTKGTTLFGRERIECRPEGVLNYTVEERFVDAAGKELSKKTYDPEPARRKAESDFEAQLHERVGDHELYDGVIPDSGSMSLACLAAARRCQGEPLTWPPPRNLTPLEHSARAKAMNLAYDAAFVPGCVF